MFGGGVTLTNESTMLGAAGQFEFLAGGGEHLLVGLMSSSLTGNFSTLELSITNNGVALFSQLFTSAGDASLFFHDRVLDLGILGGGMQDVRITSQYGYLAPGAFAFSYAVGTSAASAVPETSTWLMLVLGLGVMVAGARARRQA
jgi:hypothetical protein